MKREFCASDGVATREFKVLHNRIEDMQKEIAELKKDAARIDWLSDVKNNVGNVQLPAECVLNNMHSLRDAIDEAMEITA